MARISRRGLLLTGAAAGVLAATGMPLRAQQRGGTLRLGMSGAHPTDSWDGRRHGDSYMMVVAHGAVFDCLTEIAADGQITGELAESWEATPDARTWTFNLRRDVVFHNGAPLTADDVIASLQLHQQEDSGSAAQPIVAPIIEMNRLGDHQVQFVLNAGNADFPFLLSDYHLIIYPHASIEDAIANGIGTGLYRVESFEPGVRTLLARVDGHYKDGRAGWFNQVEVIAINDGEARMAALMTGQVDAVNKVRLDTEVLLRSNPNVVINETVGNQHYSFPMLTTLSPMDNLNIRQALKYAVNREEMVEKVLRGHGSVANDHPIGPANSYQATEIPQAEYDPERARSLLQAAGLDFLRLDLSVSNVAFEGAVAAGQLYRASAQRTGLVVDVEEVTGAEYWSDVWIKEPWCASCWAGRPTEDWMFSVGYEAGAPWNETRWENERFQSMLLEARAMLDTDLRREIYTEMQELCALEGGSVIPVYANYLQAHSAALSHPENVGNVFGMDSARIIERWWFA